MSGGSVARKYDQLDERLLQWLRENPEGATTAAAFKALGAKDSTTQRHISRRFSLLEEKRAMTCSLHGTTRICRVLVENLPGALHRGGPNTKTWRSQMTQNIHNSPGYKPPPSTSSSKTSIPANDSNEFEAAGGQIERLPSRWDSCSRGQLGPLTFADHLSELD